MLLDWPLKPYEAPATGSDRFYLAGNLLSSDADRQVLPRGGPSAFDQSFPAMRVDAGEEQQLYAAPCGVLAGIEARRNDSRLVCDEHIARPQVLLNVTKRAVLD